MEKLLTTAQFAAEAGVHPETVRRWVRTGLLQPGRTPGGRMRFTDEHLAQLGKSDSPTMMTPMQFAAKLGVTVTAVKNWIAGGGLVPVVHTTIGRVLLSQVQLDRIIAQKALSPHTSNFYPEAAARAPGAPLTREEEAEAYRRAKHRIALYRFKQNLKKSRQ